MINKYLKRLISFYQCYYIDKKNKEIVKVIWIFLLSKGRLDIITLFHSIVHYTIEKI